MDQSLKFASREDLRNWFRENHNTSPGIWVRFDSSDPENSLTPEEAQHESLCFGWVEDRIKRIDEESFRKKYIPRRDGSPWTDEEKALVAELSALGFMEKAGLLTVARSKSDGSWQTPSSSPISDAMLETFSEVLQPYELAFTNFLRLPSSTQRTYAYNYCNAKRPETRDRRLKKLIEKLNAEPLPTLGIKKS